MATNLLKTKKTTKIITQDIRFLGHLTNIPETTACPCQGHSLTGFFTLHANKDFTSSAYICVKKRLQSERLFLSIGVHI
jgi:hypothetical protein